MPKSKRLPAGAGADAAKRVARLKDIKPEVLAIAVGYAFEALRHESGPFSTVRVRHLVQRAFYDGWRASDGYRKERRR